MVAVSLNIFVELVDEGETGGRERDVPRVCRSVVFFGLAALFENFRSLWPLKMDIFEGTTGARQEYLGLLIVRVWVL